MKFEDAIFDPEFVCGSEILELKAFRTADGVISLVLRIHWWKEAEQEFEAGHPGYNRKGDDHRVVAYQFYEVGCLDLKAFHHTNGDMIDRVEHSAREWRFELAGGKLQFDASAVRFLSDENCDKFGSPVADT